MATKDELLAQIDALDAAEKNEAAEAAKAIPREFDWFCEWKSEHVFYAYRKITKKTLDAIAALKEKYPSASLPFWMNSSALKMNEGMRYGLAHNWMFQLGGGTLVLKDSGHTHLDKRDEPRWLTDAEVVSLKSSIIPDSLKRDVG